mmetsp:Transcript_29642/g.59875  ORF Transcript_29642/g.59875 Transcript_29642/m.59875 type:complete len:100 (-) Transcript_29642:1370-1669(-)
MARGSPVLQVLGLGPRIINVKCVSLKECLMNFEKVIADELGIDEIQSSMDIGPQGKLFSSRTTPHHQTQLDEINWLFDDGSGRVCFCNDAYEAARHRVV